MAMICHSVIRRMRVPIYHRIPSHIREIYAQKIQVMDQGIQIK